VPLDGWRFATFERMGIPRAVGRWAGMKLTRRLSRSVPLVGTLAAVALAGHAVRTKGLLGGLVSTGLDAIPFVGALKNGIELFTGDLIPDRTRFPGRVSASVAEASHAVRRWR
jgi:hypothetical protein